MFGGQSTGPTVLLTFNESVVIPPPQRPAGKLKVPFTVADFFGGTALLIVVGVSLDTMKQIESQLLMRHYEGFMKRGKIRGRFS